MVSRILLVTKNRGAYQGVGTFTTTATGGFAESPAPKFCSAIAGKHKGLCLGFEVDKRRVLKVRYDSLRSKKEAEEVVDKRHGTFDHIEKFLTTKYTHWKYEQEYRMLVELREADVVTKLHFWEFSESMRLTDVIIGAQSSVERAQVAKVLRELKCDVQITNARLGFKKYEVVTQNDSALWK